MKADLGATDNPLNKCLKIYQDLIAYNIKEKNEDVLIYNDFKRFEFVNGILEKDDQYQVAMEDLKAQHKDNPLSAEITSLIARNMMNQYESNSEDSAYFDNYRSRRAQRTVRVSSNASRSRRSTSPSTQCNCPTRPSPPSWNTRTRPHLIIES